MEDLFLHSMIKNVKRDLGPPGQWLAESGIDVKRLNDRRVIWKALVRFFVERRMPSTVIHARWKQIPESSLLFDIDLILARLEDAAVAGSPCLRTPFLASNCRLATRKHPQREWTRPPGASCPPGIRCPVESLTTELDWHANHYVTAKGLCEVAWRILRPHVGDLNRYVAQMLAVYPQGAAIRAILEDFAAVKWFRPGKNIRHMLRDFTLPLFGIGHFEFDAAELVPIDVHVRRLLSRHALQMEGESPEQAVRRIGSIAGVSGAEATYLLYRFGGSFELGICKSTPDCPRCKGWSQEVYDACRSAEKTPVP